MPTKKSAKTFEQNLSELEVIVRQMENNLLSLDESLASFEKGVQLVKSCQKALKTAEQKIHVLSEKHDEDEELTLIPFSNRNGE